MGLTEYVTVAGFCIIAGIAGADLTLLPVMLAMAFSSDMLAASFAGMVASIVLGAARRLAKAR